MEQVAAKLIWYSMRIFFLLLGYQVPELASSSTCFLSYGQFHKTQSNNTFKRSDDPSCSPTAFPTHLVWERAGLNSEMGLATLRRNANRGTALESVSSYYFF